MRTQIKKLRDASNKEEAQELYRETTSLLDKLASKGIIHANKAANQKSKLQHWVDQLS
jgi:small subunit ribosomal protein S20